MANAVSGAVLGSGLPGINKFFEKGIDDEKGT
jgi:hypothetical protein